MNSSPALVCTTATVDATRSLAAAVAAVCDDGDLVMLVGDLGAGKTAFTQGFSHALGVDDPVTSPTFTLANRYEGDRTVNHLDVYRLGGPEEADDLAIIELLDDGVTLIEWADIIEPALPPDRLEIVVTFGDGDDDRILTMTTAGRWAARNERLADALAPWKRP